VISWQCLHCTGLSGMASLQHLLRLVAACLLGFLACRLLERE
jgi:hypothetical protein